MNIISNNPYRTLGVLANASERELQKTRTKMNAFAKVGKAPTSEYDFSFLTPIERTPELLDGASSQIEQNPDRLAAALFWFSNQNSFDNTVLQYLAQQDTNKAIEILEKVTSGTLTAKNISTFNNYSTLLFVSGNSERVKKAVQMKEQIIRSEYFTEFSRTFTDEYFSPNKNDVLERLVNDVISAYKAEYGVRELVSLFNYCSTALKEQIANRFVDEPIHNIEMAIAKCAQEREYVKAVYVAEKLFDEVSEPLSQIAFLLGENHLKYKLQADNVAKEMKQCCITNFNATNKPQYDRLLEILYIALNVAASEHVKSFIQEYIDILTRQKGQNEYICSFMDKLPELKKCLNYEQLSKFVKFFQSKFVYLPQKEKFYKFTDEIVIAIQNKLVEFVNRDIKEFKLTKNTNNLYQNLCSAKSISENLKNFPMSSEVCQQVNENHNDLMVIYSFIYSKVFGKYNSNNKGCLYSLVSSLFVVGFNLLKMLIPILIISAIFNLLS